MRSGRTGAILCGWMLFCSSVPSAGRAVGHLVLFGGGERRPELWQRFLERSSARAGPIVILPTASELEETGQVYRTELATLAPDREVVVLEVRSREDAERADGIEKILSASGIFFTGGDQSRLTKALLGSPLLEAIRRAWKAGACVGGTSAGLAAVADPMFTGEGDPARLRAGSVELVQGLGLVTGVLLDQHFLARGRFERLLAAVLEHPHRLGIGVDEETALDWRPDGTFEVVGRRQVVVLDARGATLLRREAVRGEGVLLAGHALELTVLLPGESFDPRLGPLGTDRLPSSAGRLRSVP